MGKEYIVTRHTVETTEEEKEEIYKRLADIFIRMAQKEWAEQKKGSDNKWQSNKNFTAN